jgi:hypothetical protein
VAAPLGDIQAHATEWGISLQEIYSLFNGLSPWSGGIFTLEEAHALHAASLEDGAGKDLAFSNRDPQEVVDKLRASNGALGKELDKILNIVGLRNSTGFSLADPSVIELPDLIITQLQSCIKSKMVKIVPDVSAVRNKVLPIYFCSCVNLN